MPCMASWIWRTTGNSLLISKYISRFSENLYITRALVFHKVDALHRVLNLAHHWELLAHLEIDLQILGELFHPIVGLGQIYQHGRIVGFDLVLPALVAAGFEMQQGPRIIPLAQIIAAERAVQREKLLALPDLGKYAGARDDLGALGLDTQALQHYISKNVRIGRLLLGEFLPHGQRLRLRLQLVARGGLAHPRALAVGRWCLRQREKRLIRPQRPLQLAGSGIRLR